MCFDDRGGRKQTGAVVLAMMYGWPSTVLPSVTDSMVPAVDAVIRKLQLSNALQVSACVVAA